MFLTREDGMILGPVCWVLGKIFNWIYMFVGFIGNHMGITYVNLSVCVILFTFVLVHCSHYISNSRDLPRS